MNITFVLCNKRSKKSKRRTFAFKVRLLLFLAYREGTLNLYRACLSRLDEKNTTFEYYIFGACLSCLYIRCVLILISIYTLSDLGDLSNLIGSLSRTILQYSPPSEWIMCELGVFHIFLENDLLKVDKILGLTFLRQVQSWKDSIRDIVRRFSIYWS